MSSNHFVFDKNKCVGCEACVVACVNENSFQAPDQWRSISSSNPYKHPDLPLFHLSMACNHCEDAPCMKYCPAMAFKRSKQTGAVLHIENHCIGCKYCTWQCPYDAPKYNPIKGTVEKCTFCESRLLEGQKPACTSLCPTGALDFSSSVYKRDIVNKDLKLASSPKPSIEIKELHNANGPKVDLSLFTDEAFIEIPIAKQSKINALKEWPLVLFTLIIALLNSIQLSGLNMNTIIFGKEGFLILGALGAILSSLHLGRKERMWRSVLNIRHSWLSREIVFFGLFMAGSFIHFYIYDLSFWLIACFSFLLSVSVDMLYQPAHWHWKTKIHSAQLTLSTLSLSLLFAGQMKLFVVLMGIRMLLFLYRKMGNSLSNTQWIFSTLRIIGAVLAIAFLIFNYSTWIIVLPFAIAEIIDRIDYYNELNVPEPAELIRTAKI